MIITNKSIITGVLSFTLLGCFSNSHQLSLQLDSIDEIKIGDCRSDERNIVPVIRDSLSSSNYIFFSSN